MNQKTTYEITITEKLGQLPLPDIRDAIWSRIEQQLDLDMPGDDDPQNPSSPDNGSWRKTGWKVGPFAVIVAIVTIFFINKNKQPLNSNTENKQPQNIESPLPQKNGPPFSPMRTMQADEKGGSINSTSNIPLQRNDSVFSGSPVLFTPPDTALITTKNKLADIQQSAQPPPPLRDSTPKKSRGVKGITDNDYHITLKKDSVP